ncbi:unnamed protein product, partial [marine sediment metagenome]
GQWKMVNLFSMEEWGAKANYDMAVFKINTEIKMAEWSAKTDIYKMGINQAYTQDNMILASQIANAAAAQQNLWDIEMAKMEMEYNQKAAEAEAKGSISGTIVTGLFTVAAAFICWIVDELYGLNTAEGEILFHEVNYDWPKTFIGRIGYKLYKKFGKRIALFISEKGVLNFVVRKGLKLFFDYRLNKANKISEEGIVKI